MPRGHGSLEDENTMACRARSGYELRTCDGGLVRRRTADARRRTTPLACESALTGGGHACDVRDLVRNLVRVTSPGRRRSEMALVQLRRLVAVLEHRGALYTDGPPPAVRRRARRVRTAFEENETTVQNSKFIRKTFTTVRHVGRATLRRRKS